MVNLTITIPDDLRKELKKHDEVNWSAVIRKAISEHLRNISIAEAIARKSKLTKKDADEISRMIKREMAKEFI
jgi:predicted CopG family antitoxin